MREASTAIASAVKSSAGLLLAALASMGTNAWITPHWATDSTPTSNGMSHAARKVSPKGRLLGSAAGTPITVKPATAASAAAVRNSDRGPTPRSSVRPSGGQIAIATLPAAPNVANATVCARDLTRCGTNEYVPGTTAARPKPWIRRSRKSAGAAVSAL